ncbi:894_t:CDS:2, partial [Dentiscutata erythropus]
MKFLNLFFVCFLLSFSQTSFATQCFPTNGGVGPSMPFFRIIKPSADSYSMNEPLFVNWTGFRIDDNPNLLIQLWSGDINIKNYSEAVYYKNSSVNWINWITPDENSSGLCIRIFRGDNPCIYGIGPVRPSFKISKPSLDRYRVGTPLKVSWDGFLIKDNQLWENDTYKTSYRKRVFYDKRSITWITPNFPGGNYVIRIFEKNNRCIR